MYFSEVISIEGSSAISEIAQRQLESFNIPNVNFKIGSFKEVLPNLQQNTFDLIFFDGHHDKQATLDYFELLLPTLHNNSVWIFDDIYWSKGMTEAWETIKAYDKVKVTIDLFHYGMVFFRKEQAKEHFKIRF